MNDRVEIKNTVRLNLVLNTVNLVFKYSGIFWLRVYEVVGCCFTWEDVIVPSERERNIKSKSRHLVANFVGAVPFPIGQNLR